MVDNPILYFDVDLIVKKDFCEVNTYISPLYRESMANQMIEIIKAIYHFTESAIGPFVTSINGGFSFTPYVDTKASLVDRGLSGQCLLIGLMKC